MIWQTLVDLWYGTGFANMSIQNLIMIGIALFLIYLAIARGYEPLLLLPISFGMLIANLPLGDLMQGPTTKLDGLLMILEQKGTVNRSGGCRGASCRCRGPGCADPATGEQWCGC